MTEAKAKDHEVLPSQFERARILAGFHGHRLGGELKELISEGLLAGVILFRRNIESPAQLRDLCAAIKAAFPSELPPIIAVDQEGGRVQRLVAPKVPVEAIPPMKELAQSYSREDFYELGRSMSLSLQSYGFNTNFAPVLDIDTRPENPIIGNRAFGSSAEEVIEHAFAYVEGLESTGLIWCGKHFPGHGDTLLDSHLALPTLTQSKERLEEVELRPFREAVRRQAPILMTAHIIYEALDKEWPATLSRHIIPKILRESWAYDGVVASDDMEMRAILDHYNLDDMLLGLEAATVDLVLVCEDLKLARKLGEGLPVNPKAAKRLMALRKKFLKV